MNWTPPRLKAVANKVNDAHGWKNENSQGWITPDQVLKVIRGTATASHPITQEIQATINEYTKHPTTA